jgi:superfamily I DNA/RNA helicase
VAVLALLLTGVIYKFVIQGDVIESVDGRTTIQLDNNERDLVLSEMRVFLESVQQITRGISDKNMNRVAEYARKSGQNAQMEVPGSLIGKLPLPFKKLGFDTHAKFDELALDAEQLGDRGHTLSQLNVLLKNCVACHAAYRFDTTTHYPM